MKWLEKDCVSRKTVCIPNNSISRRNTKLLISALVRYSVTKRKYQSDDALGNKVISCHNRHYPLDESIAHEPKKKHNSITKQELTAIQIQLAMLSDNDGDRPIHIAVANENLKLVQKLCLLMVKNSISLDITNCLRQTPLHLAVMIGNVEILRCLLKYGASPLICDRNGNSVLHLAVKSNSNQDVFDILLSQVQVKNILNLMDYEGYSALHYAVFKNNSNAIRLLHVSGADMNIIDGKSGRSALIHAVLEQNAGIVNLLLNCDASPQKVDYSGQSAFEMALQIANSSIITLLEKWMPHNEVTKLREPPVIHTPTEIAKRTKI